MGFRLEGGPYKQLYYPGVCSFFNNCRCFLKKHINLNNEKSWQIEKSHKNIYYLSSQWFVCRIDTIGHGLQIWHKWNIDSVRCWKYNLNRFKSILQRVYYCTIWPEIKGLPHVLENLEISWSIFQACRTNGKWKKTLKRSGNAVKHIPYFISEFSKSGQNQWNPINKINKREACLLMIKNWSFHSQEKGSLLWWHLFTLHL